MLLGGDLQIASAVKYAADLMAGCHRSHADLAAQNRRIILLAAEGAARYILCNADLFIRQAQGALGRTEYIVRALHGAMQENPAIRQRLRHHGLRLEICLILIARLEHFCINLIRLCKGLFNIALFHGVIEENLIGFLDVRDDRQILINDLDGIENAVYRLFIRSADHADGLADIFYCILGINRHVVKYDIDIVIAANILLVDIITALRQLRHLDIHQFSMCLRGAEKLADQNIILHIVTDIKSLTRKLGVMIPSDNGFTDIFHPDLTTFRNSFNS